MTLGDRIKQVRNGLSQRDFCKKFHISINTLRRYENEDNPPDANFLLALCREYDLNPTWLLTGEESMQQLGENESLQEYHEKTCDCMSESRLEQRGNLLGNGGGDVDFDLLQHIINEISNFRINRPEKLSEEELKEVSMVSYSLCQTGNRISAGLICRIVEGWLEKKGGSKGEIQVL